MAAINDLISQIQDETLRNRIQEEVSKMAKQKKFGLVFEEQMLCLVALIEFAVAMAMLLLEQTMLGITVQKSYPHLHLDRLNHSFRRS